jgi:hypothetical protein
MKAQGGNPKTENRKPKTESNPNVQMTEEKADPRVTPSEDNLLRRLLGHPTPKSLQFGSFGHSDLIRISDFEFRISGRVQIRSSNKFKPPTSGVR